MTIENSIPTPKVLDLDFEGLHGIRKPILPLELSRSFMEVFEKTSNTQFSDNSSKVSKASKKIRDLIREQYTEKDVVIFQITARPGSAALETLPQFVNLFNNINTHCIKNLNTMHSKEFISVDDISQRGTLIWFDTAKPMRVSRSVIPKILEISKFATRDLEKYLNKVQLNNDTVTTTNFIYYHAMILLHKLRISQPQIFSSDESYKNFVETIGYDQLEKLYGYGLSFAFVVAPIQGDIQKFISKIQGSIEQQSQTGEIEDGMLFGLPLDDDNGNRYYIARATPNWTIRSSSQGASLPCIGPGSLAQAVSNDDIRLRLVEKMRRDGPLSEQTLNENTPKVRVYVLDTILSDKLRSTQPTSSFQDLMSATFPWWKNPNFAEVPLTLETKTFEEGQNTSLSQPPYSKSPSIPVTLTRHTSFYNARSAALGAYTISSQAGQILKNIATLPAISPNRPLLEVDLSNHGLFVTDVLYREIPSALRPNVEIRLVETGNQRGSGYLDVLLKVLHWVWKDIQSSDADYYVINISMSVGVNNVLSDFTSLEHDNILIPDSPEYQKHVLEVVRLFESLFRPLKAIKPGKVILVAAAGNDTLKAKEIDDGLQRQPAAIPARLPSVLGVSAGIYKEHSLSPTTYTNIADTKIRLNLFGKELAIIGDYGIMAFGGDIDVEDWEKTYKNGLPLLIPPLPKGTRWIWLPKAKHGVIAPYFGPLIDRLAHPDVVSPIMGTPLVRWAEWSGTSFAAPKVAGRIVRELLAGASTVEEAVEQLTYSKEPTKSNERVLLDNPNEIPSST